MPFWRRRKPAAEPQLTGEDHAKLRLIMELVTPDGQPNVHALLPAIRNIEAVHLNLKFFGYDLARRLAAAYSPPEHTAPRHVGLACKASVQADIESDWAAHWHRALGIPLVYHRKIWELAYVLQAVWEEGHLVPGVRALGFGCGTEPLPSYFMAQGMAVTITDLPMEQATERGWAASRQHATDLDKAFHPHLVDRATFDRLASIRYVDMNAIPDDLTGYDVCWSVCAFEHLGSIELGLRFIERTLETLKPGGLSVHTTEYNINPDGPTVDNWPSVMFQRKHFEVLAERLRAKGHEVAPFDFDLGSGPLDRFIDLPPWSHDLPPALSEWIGPQDHLKVATDGFVATCFGLKIKKAG
jgi:SAM-dependent methyltransferase